MTRLTTIAYLGFILLGCDSSGVDPIQQNTGGTTSTGGATGTTPHSTLGGGGQVQGGNSSVGGTAGATNTTVPAAGATSGSCPIVPTEASGWVDGTTSDCKIQGAWYAYNDCETSPTDCTTNQLPVVGSTDGFPNVGGKMCTSGTTVPISKQYDIKWGAGIGLNLNQAAGSDDKGTISALPHALKGFSFTLSANNNVDLPEIRVNYPMPTTEKTAHFKKILVNAVGPYTVLFTDSDVVQGDWVTDKVPLVPGDINAIQFQVVGSDSVPIAFDFCVDKLTALY